MPGYSSPIIPLNAPNLLTLARIALVPFLVLAIARGELVLAGGIFVLASVTDAADGYLARSRNLITTFGRLADPVADKLLVGAALLSLVAVERLAMWIALVVIGREVAVSALRWYASTGGVTIAVSGLGKAKTAVQMTALTALMVTTDPTALWVDGMLAAVVAVTVASGVEYFIGYQRGEADAPARAVTVARW